MRIAVDARNFEVKKAGSYFIKEVFYRLVKVHSKHSFLFFFDNPGNALTNLPENVTSVLITPKPTNILMYKWWYDVKIYLALKKHKADIFIGTNGICSLTTNVPQLLIMHDLAFLQNLDSLPKNIRFFYNRFTNRFLKKAAAIAVFSDFIEKEITCKYAIAEGKITVIAIAAASLFTPLLWEERERTKDQYAQGCEYFIFTGGLEPRKNFISLLKAFSLFKKRQKTNMKLLVAGNLEKYKHEAEKLNSYKYKSDIHLTGDLSAGDLARVIGAAYAMVFPSYYEGHGLTVLQAMQCEVPVITAAGSSMSAAAGEAALYADPAKPEEIAEQMKRIFKDELLRNKLIAAAKERIKLYNFDKTTALAWQAIEKAVYK